MRLALAAASLVALLTGCQQEEMDAIDVHLAASDQWGIVYDGFMTGGGSVFTRDGMRVTHGFELHCDGSDPNNLQINWEGNHFHLDGLDYQDCTNNPSIDPGQPYATFDEYYGDGWGVYNNTEEATIQFVLRDAGEPGSKDHAAFRIYDSDGNLLLRVGGNLNKGNHQAHTEH